MPTRTVPRTLLGTIPVEILHHSSGLNTTSAFIVWLRRISHCEATGSSPSRCQLPGFDLVHVAPHPGLARLDGANQGMLRVMKMLRRMLVFGRIATCDVAADQAQAQVDPPVAHFYAFFTDVRVRLANFNLIEVCTFRWH
jgi:hypothetical protein